MRLLIFGTSYLATDEKQWVAQQWARLHSQVNPEADLLFVDSASPLMLPPDVGVLQLGDNIGHAWGCPAEKGGGDGWGRAFVAGLNYACYSGYDWVGCIESDVLCKVSTRDLIEETVKAGKTVGAPIAHPHSFLEVGLMVLNVDYLRRSNLAGRYKWQELGIMPEDRVRKLIGDENLHILSRLSGTRLEGQTMQNLPGMDYMTHGGRADFEKFLGGIKT